MVLFVLRFYGPVNPMGSCRARSVYLITHLLGRLSPLSGYNQYCAHSFARNWQLPFLNQRKGENDRRKYFMIYLHERMLPTSAGVEPATSWSPVGRRIQLSHRGPGTMVIPPWLGLPKSRTNLHGPKDVRAFEFQMYSIIYSRLSLSRIPRDSLKYFEISVPRHIRVERVRKTINWTTTFNKWMRNLTPEVKKIYIK